MKQILLALALFAALDAFAERQYIQCALKDQPSSTMGVIINLDGVGSTLYITNGVQKIDEIDFVLKELKKDSETDTHQIYRSGRVKIHAKVNTIELVEINKIDLGVATNYMEVTLKVLNFDQNLRQELLLSCFSSMHEF